MSGPGSTGAKRWRIERHDSVGSTQDVLKQRVAAGNDVTCLVVRAREQTGGRGRRGARWLSSAGGSYQSLGLGPVTALGGGAPDLDEAALSRLPLALAVGVAEELCSAGAKVAVKWPNDLMLVAAGARSGALARGAGRFTAAASGDTSSAGKLGGLLVEVSAGQALAGIGVNVDNAVPDGAGALRGWDVDTVGDLVIEGVLAGLDLAGEDADALVRRLTPLDWLRGREVSVETADTVVTGEAVGIDRRGCLRLKLTSPAAESSAQLGKSAYAVSRVVTVCRGHVLSIA
ncbi:MAG TPA: biotin--[acetyl-CoA-carboxylase] ligase [Trueperaceae bacterium]|nr:biotin--[acetyl-CoA-carboxylase] ligase [Trueperaceae bacterium]